MITKVVKVVMEVDVEKGVAKKVLGFVVEVESKKK